MNEKRPSQREIGKPERDSRMDAFQERKTGRKGRLRKKDTSLKTAGFASMNAMGKTKA